MKKVLLSDKELDLYTKIAALSKEFLREFESENNSQKYNDLKIWSLNLSFRIVQPALRGQEIREEDLHNINKIFNKNLDMFHKYKNDYQIKNDNSALEQIRKEMNSSQVKEEAAQVNVRKNR